MKKLSLVYFGTPDFSARFLEKLLQDETLPIDVKLVVTQPDKPVGRQQVVTKSPVKIVAEKYDVEVYDKEIKNLKLKIKNFDLAFLFAYGNIIPKELLNQPHLGFLNTHPSLLPKYRGPGPITYPLILGDKKTGVTLIKLDEKIDHGPIVAQQETQISPHDRRPELEVKLTDLAFQLFKKTAKKLISTDFNRFKLIQQNHSYATFTRLLTKDDGFIPFSTLKKAINNQQLTIDEIPKIIYDYQKTYSLSTNYQLPSTLNNLFRGLYPWPGIWTKVVIKGQERRLKIIDADLVGNGRDRSLQIKRIQLEGKKEVDFGTFNKAYRIF